MSSSNGAVARIDQGTAVDQVGNRPVTPMEMLQQAVERGASLEVVEKLMTLQERWEAHQARRAFDEAMAQAKATMPILSRNRSVSFGSGNSATSYRHEDLGEIARVVGPVLSAQGLSYRYRTVTKDDGVAVTCIISHRDGHSEETTLSAAHDKSGGKNAIQAIGSAVTYLQRYTLKAALGLAASSDDDGKASEPSAKEVLNEEQLWRLRDAMRIRGITEEQALKRFKVEALEDLWASKFDDAMKIVKAAGATR